MEVIKQISELGTYDIYIKQDNKILKIIFGANGDLYWLLTNLDKKDIDTIQELHETFTITKENYFLYSLFEELMYEIKEAKVYKPLTNPNDSEEISIDTELDDEPNLFEEEKLCNKWNEELKNRYRYKLLYNNGIVSWHSDETEYSISDLVNISKIDDTFLLEFTRPALTDNKYELRTSSTISIRFRNSGSTYDPFNIIFMRMFRKLEEYNPELHQIHLEELIYHQKKLTKHQNNKKGHI